MTSHLVAFRAEAIEHLAQLHDYIADAGAPDSAAEFTEAIISFCESLARFPSRGTARDDIRPGLRTIGYRRRAVIAFTILGDTVVILGVFYGGRDYESILSTQDPRRPHQRRQPPAVVRLSHGGTRFGV